MMCKQECIIGVLHYCDCSKLVTLSELKEYIEEEIVKFNYMCVREGFTNLMRKGWSLKDYADKRKSTNLTRFNFCPECGKCIDWAMIRRSDNALETML